MSTFPIPREPHALPCVHTGCSNPTRIHETAVHYCLDHAPPEASNEVALVRGFDLWFEDAELWLAALPPNHPKPSWAALASSAFTEGVRLGRTLGTEESGPVKLS